MNFKNVESLDEQNKCEKFYFNEILFFFVFFCFLWFLFFKDNKIKKQLQVEDLSEDGPQVNLRLNLIENLKEALKPEFDALKEAQEKLTLSMADLTEKISQDCCHKNEIVEILSEFSTLKEQIKISLNDQNRKQATFEEQLNRIEAAIKSVTTTTTTTPVPTATTTAPVPIPINIAQFDENLNCVVICGDPKDHPNVCWEVKNENENENGIFVLKRPQGSDLKPFGAVCLNHENKNWTIIQRRLFNKTVSFDRNWEEYRNGFGDLNGEYWLGLERLHQLTANENYELWMEERDKNGDTKWSMHYTEFSVADEGNGYGLKVDGFNGKNWDYMRNFDGSKFSTYDNNNSGNEVINFARDYGGGWWYDNDWDYGFNRGLNSNWFNGCYTLMAIYPA